VPPADRVRLKDQVDGVGVLLAVNRDRAPLLEGDRDVLGQDLDGRVPEADAHDRLDELDARVEVLELLGLVGGAPDVRVGGVGLLTCWPGKGARGRRATGNISARPPSSPTNSASSQGL